MDDTTTLQEQLAEVLEPGDTLEALDCFWMDHEGVWYGWYDEPPPPITRCDGLHLPDRKFDSGYGGTDANPCICYSDRYVYIRWRYDGAEGFTAIPRHPAYVGPNIPWPGGG